MRKIRESGDDAVLEQIKKTYPNFKLCSYENLVMIKNQDKISNPSRFWNKNSEILLHAINDINNTFYHYPDKQKLKIISSIHYQTWFEEMFKFLKKKTKSTKNKKKQSLEEITTMMNLSEKFLKVGLDGMKITMPDEFQEILQTKIDDIMLQMKSITELTKRLSPKSSNAVDFNFDFHPKKNVTTKKIVK